MSEKKKIKRATIQIEPDEGMNDGKRYWEFIIFALHGEGLVRIMNDTIYTSKTLARADARALTT